MQETQTRSVGRQIIVLALLASLASTFIGIGFPGRSAFATTPDPAPHRLLEFACIFSQAFLLTIPSVAIVFLVPCRNRRAAYFIGSLVILTLPALMLLNGFVFAWIGERLLSSVTWRIFTELGGGLAGHVSLGMIASVALLLFILAIILAVILWMKNWISRILDARTTPSRPGFVAIIVAVIAACFATPPLIDHSSSMRSAMAARSTRHPFCVMGWNPARASFDSVARSTKAIESSWTEAVLARDHQQRRLAVDLDVTSARQSPDIVIVIVESFRRELVTPEVMPNLWQYAQRGIQCRSHFSGGNATNHGVFSLLNGLEAIWYERQVRYSPLMNRLFRAAGYELGFFAGHDDWRKFYMDGFVSEQHFDVFEIIKPNGLASDRRATELASMFLERKDGPGSEPRRPRLALLYLYATHAMYESYAEDRVFKPAADDRFLYPYSESARSCVWNRYKNSAHTVDRFLAAVMREDRVVIVTGDHGESFLEDGTIGHGLRISEVQNMTPAIIFLPSHPSRVIDAPTSHADLLPTLLTAVDIAVSDPSALDGANLSSISDAELDERVFATRNYLDDNVAVIGPWTTKADEPFAFLFGCSLRQMSLQPRHAIDARGEAMPASPATQVESMVDQWSRLRFDR